MQPRENAKENDMIFVGGSIFVMCRNFVIFFAELKIGFIFAALFSKD